MTDKNITISYDSLTKPITRDEVKHYAEGMGTPPYFLRSVLITILVIVGIIVSILSEPSPTTPLAYATLLVFIGGFVLYSVTTYRGRQKRFARLQRFAKLNNAKAKSNSYPQGYDGEIFNHGHSRCIDLALTFGDGLELGSYTYAEGHGRNTRYYHWSYAFISLNRPMPHIILDAKSNNSFRKFTNLPISYQSTQKISLEGDFDSYFTLYAPEGYNKDILYLFTPDVMAVLIDYGKDYDIEIINQTMYLYSSRPLHLDSEKSIKPFVSIIYTLSKKIAAQNQNYRDERMQDTSNTKQRVGLYSQTTAIAPQGRRLKTSLKLSSVVTFIIVAVFIIAQLIQ